MNTTPFDTQTFEAALREHIKKKREIVILQNKQDALQAELAKLQKALSDVTNEIHQKLNAPGAKPEWEKMVERYIQDNV